MADTVVSDAALHPHDEGLPSITDGNEDWNSAGLQMLLGQAVQSGSYVRSDTELDFGSHDGTSDNVDVQAGVAYIALVSETINVQSTLGGSSSPSYDTTVTAATMPAICVVCPTATTVSLQDSTLSDVWLAYATDGTVSGVDAGDVYIRSDDTGSVSAPSHPSVKLGQANPDDSTADVLTNRFPSPKFQTITNHNYVEKQVTASEGTSYTADLADANYHKVTMTGDVTFDVSNDDGSDVNSLVLHLVQDGTGGRTPSFTPTVVWDAGSAPSWSTSANAEDVVTLVHDQDGSQWLGFVGGLGMA